VVAVVQRALDAGSNIKELSYVAAILKILSFGVSEDTSVIFEVAKRDGLRPTQRMYDAAAGRLDGELISSY
jgi:hypothetical protein